MFKDKINTNTAIGLIAGIGVGRYIFKSKSVLFLTVFGVTSGLLTNYLVNKYGKKTPEDKYLSDMEKNIKIDDEKIANSLRKELASESSNFYGVNKEMEFNKQLGYHVPIDYELKIDKASDYMDLD